MSRENEFFSAVAARGLVRPSVRAIVIANESVLVQRPTDSGSSHYAFIGGKYEVGDTFESRLNQEFEQETNARVVEARYCFVFENRFEWNGRLVHSLEHYFEVRLDRTDVQSREPALAQHWLALGQLSRMDVRSHAVRNAIVEGNWRAIGRLGDEP